MSSRIIRSDDRIRKLKIRADSGLDLGSLVVQDQITNIEKQAFEQGYLEGQRAGKEMGERMVEAAAKRYDRSITDMVTAHQSVLSKMETQTVQLSLEIARKVIQRELTMDPDLVSALASVALKRVQSHQAITLRVSRQDYARVREVVALTNPSVIVQEDPSLERGDFMIDTSQTHLDGRVLSQVETLGRAMLED
jgi:flagellar assembly protein FliH